MFVLIYNERIFGGELKKPNTLALDDIVKPQHKKILVLASLPYFFLKLFT